MSLNCSDGWNGSCSNSYQNDLANSGCVAFDPDIVGIGVIVAFILTSLIAFLSVVIGYVFLAIPVYLLNRTDVLIINTCRSALGRAGNIETVEDASNSTRSEALQSFLLSISDQQLVTSIALLIAGFARHSSITAYSMDVIAALAVLSSGVHLETLPLVRSNLRRHFVSKVLRVFFMISTFVALVFLMIVQAGALWYQTVFFSCGVFNFTLRGVDPSAFAAQLLLVVGLAIAYTDAIIGLHHPDDEVDSIISYFSILYSKRHNIAEIPSQQQIMRYIAKKRTGGSWNRVFSVALLESFAFHEFFESFACSISWFLFLQVYGVIQVFQTRSEPSGSTGDMNVMGFGQIVPLVLLTLPVLAALEARDDYKYNTSQDEQELQENSFTVKDRAASIHQETSIESTTFTVSLAHGYLSEGQSTEAASDGVELVSLDAIPENSGTQSPDTPNADSDDHTSPNRADTEARIGDSFSGLNTSSSPKVAPLPYILTRWTEESADPYQWVDVQVIIYCYLMVMVFFVTIYALANQFVWPFTASAYTNLTIILFVSGYRLMIGKYSSIRIAKKMKSSAKATATSSQAF